MTEVFLISEDWVRKNTDLDENIPAKYISNAIREAQEIKLKRIIGENLLNELKSRVTNKSLTDAHKALIGQIRWFLGYTITADVIVKVSRKITPAGLVATGDENVTPLSYNDVVSTQAYYQTKADASKKDLQNYVLNHRTEFPELTEGDCHRIHSDLFSQGSCHISLGGARGKRIR